MTIYEQKLVCWLWLMQKKLVLV